MGLNAVYQFFKKKKIDHQFGNDDIFLVSYPRSGNTWVRYALSLAHPCGIELNGDIHKIIPNIDSNPDLSSVPNPRILKTHSPFNNKFNKVIYLLRNGGDAVLSYYKFSKIEENYNGTFLEFLTSNNSKCYGVSWHEHVETWLPEDYDENKIMLVRYEDLKENFIEEFQRILTFCNWNLSEKKLSEIAKEVDINSMKKKQSDGMFLAHVGEGNTGHWTSKYTDEERAAFLTYSRHTLEKFGYLFKDETNNK